MNVTIIGTGYVGLVTGTCLAEMGNQIHCVDIDKEKIRLLNDGVIPIYEPGLEELVKSNVEAKRLHFNTELEPALDQSEIVMIAVGTPPNEDGSADLQHVLSVAKSIGQKMKSYKLIVTKSTVPVGTGDLVKKTIQEELKSRNENINFSVASNPEFLKEGAAVQDCMRPDRIVIGCSERQAEELLSRLYAPFVKNGHRVITMDVRSAELCKYASNSMLATKISFMNELSRVAEAVNADISMVRTGMGADQRIGYAFTHPGVGYGGSCFPKDVKALIRTANTLGVKTSLMDAVEEVNKTQREFFIKKIFDYFEENLSGKKIAIWGLSFKPETDDVREAPALDIVKALLDADAEVVAYDPIAEKTFEAAFGTHAKLSYAKEPYAALKNAHALVICTEWKPFRSPDFTRMKVEMSAPAIFDGRNLYEPALMRDMKFHYAGIGR